LEFLREPFMERLPACEILCLLDLAGLMGLLSRTRLGLQLLQSGLGSDERLRRVALLLLGLLRRQTRRLGLLVGAVQRLLCLSQGVLALLQSRPLGRQGRFMVRDGVLQLAEVDLLRRQLLLGTVQLLRRLGLLCLYLFQGLGALL
jgi:hypothetical protein